ncbi:MAG: CPBP family intramembrane metalloprotease [Bacteroidales bacterium]|nr:CPBP family intramembrane metalloprotease [Bacteroidales bacterium]
MKKSDLVLTLGQRLGLLLCIFIVCYVLTSVLAMFLGKILVAKPAAAMRITAMAQDILAFIIPAVATACVVTRKPAELLAITRLRNPLWMAAIIVVMVVSIPAQELIIHWNENIHFPATAETIFRAMEDAAQAAMRILLADTSVPALIVNILIIGVAAGFAEEFLFRGCFQRLLVTGGVNPHAAIWIVAFVFSALHFQAFGFVPRLLLGAYFGYLLFWTRSIWAPVLAHALNNTIFVITAWAELRRNPDAMLSGHAIEFSWAVIALSFLATAALLIYLHRTATSRAD